VKADAPVQGQHGVAVEVVSAGRRRGETGTGEGNGPAIVPSSARIVQKAGISDLDGAPADRGGVM